MQGTGEITPTSPHRRASLKVLSRNINQVTLGNLVFDTWYYSPYPDSIILDQNSHPNKINGNGDARNGHSYSQYPVKTEPACARLHVCPFCFRYSPKLDAYLTHLHHHDIESQEQQTETSPVPETAFKVYEWEGYAVWEVDGEQEKLYCQNLSLFGKLFLEQKSVFFDTSGFKYYVLTYSPSLVGSPVRSGRGRRRGSSSLDNDLTSKPQVLGFFSKENLSWDSNNLACILIFPPFQHRQLGQLLMAVSYKLSGWEWEGGVIGGPEKPLSAMGRKSYLRFWSERIARFMMGQTADADGRRVFDRARKKRVHLSKEEMTVKEIGDRTGMLPEDVVAALNEMGVCNFKPRKRKKTSTGSNGAAPGGSVEEDQLATMTIHRSKVLQWAEKHQIDVVSPVKEEGFLGEWALSDIDDEDDAEGEGDSSDEATNSNESD